MAKKKTDSAQSPKKVALTDREMRQQGLERLNRRLREMGKSASWLAGQLTLRRQTVSDWTMVPDHHLPAVSKLTNLKAGDLRPDLRHLFEMVKEAA